MPLRLQRTLCVLLLALFFCPSILFAEDILLKTGKFYKGARVVGRDTWGMNIQTEYGPIKIPYSAIESINGQPLSAPPPPPPPTATPAIPIDVQQPNGGTNQPSSEAKSAKAEPPPPPYVHDWQMDIFLLSFGVIAGVWIAMLLWVQKDVDQRHSSHSDIPKKWNTIVLLLPGIGLVWYLVNRWTEMRREAETQALAEQAAAGLDIPEPPGKRGLFGGRTKVTMEPRAKQRIGFEFLDDSGNPIEIKKDLPEMTGIEAARDVLEEAIMERASDVHVEPHEKEYRVRFRVDGLLQERLVFEKADGTRVVSALKTLAAIDVAEKRKAQDGRFRVRTGVRDVDFRVATAASIFGEKMVLRILDRKGGHLSLGDVGMSEAMMAEFDRVIHSRNGIILATGPTGCGKTSTLYAALSRLDTKRLNVMTIEDPVEYELEGATQIPVNPRAGVTYESGLRSILRQDPDVIFVGEMRDKEAAEIAIRAALTGHLVFSSLHTRDAIGSIARLEDIGVEKYQISSALLLVVAQRLVRVVCKDCREPYQSTGYELKDLGVSIPSGQLIYRARGCELCDGTGYQGRTGIFELLVLDEELRKAINESASQQAQVEIIRSKGFQTYHQDGADKIVNGITSVEEVLQAS